MNTLQDLIQRLTDIQQLRGPDCKVIVKTKDGELSIDGVRGDTSTRNSIVMITVS